MVEAIEDSPVVDYLAEDYEDLIMIFLPQIWS
jgi:hypothetical protein